MLPVPDTVEHSPPVGQDKLCFCRIGVESQATVYPEPPTCGITDVDS